MKKTLQRGTLWIFNLVILLLICAVLFQFYNQYTTYFKGTKELRFDSSDDPTLKAILEAQKHIKLTIIGLFFVILTKLSLYIYWLPPDNPNKVFLNGVWSSIKKTTKEE